MDITVIGAGVIGLTSAIRLIEAGHRVQIHTQAPTAETTSAVAAAVWYPYQAFPQDAVNRWAAVTYAELVRLAVDPRAGIVQRAGIELYRGTPPDPWWRDAVPDFRHASRDELPPAYAGGFMFSAPVVEMPRYLPYLEARFAATGGTVARVSYGAPEQAFDTADLVVNCAGLGARAFGDHDLIAIRGQIVRVAQVGLERFIFDDEHPDGVTYIVPRISDIILGGTAQRGAESLAVEPATADAIIERCCELEPRLRDARILEHRVGLRPGRPAVRLEPESHMRGCIIHNYGHGGAGVTLAWGCADDVVALVAHASA
jgi:D-amino-acid oxidase